MESVCRGNSTVGSNPTLSARFITYVVAITCRHQNCLVSVRIPSQIDSPAFDRMDPNWRRQYPIDLLGSLSG